ncbi:MAG: thiamine pyrophosphate-dependent enzyme, partial [Phycisphaerae bacterium]|nr:thiamine pyrophosphate-dependent enzyme [Phycisphaerae bacterium]
ELYGRSTGCSGGRGGSMHMFAPQVGLLGTNGLVGAGVPLAVGAALSAKVRGSGQVAVAFFGDGASNHAAFLESINFAAVQKLPVLLVCENNLYATATPLSAVTANPDVASKAAAFGCAGVAVDGNDVLAVWQVARDAVARARAGQGPTLIECRTYRWCGHHEGDPVSGTYRTEAEVAAWKKRCPLAAFRTLILDKLKVASQAELKAIDEQVAAEVDEAVQYGASGPDPDPATAFDHVLASPLNPPMPATPAGEPVEQGWMEAVRDGIAEEMRRNPATAYLGEGVGDRGGCFGHTKALFKEFGGQRVIDTPISELGFTGAAIGASATGCRTVADVMFADFLFEAGSQIIHQAAKLRYISNNQVSVPVVLRAPAGMVKSAAAHHSGFYSPVWGHIPGLIVVIPSTPADAKGLMKTALRASDPVVFLEHKGMFATRGPVPQGEHLIPFGVANVVREGANLTIATCGQMTHRCLEAAEALAAKGISCEVIDLRTIVPLDVQAVVASVRKTGRLLVVDEAWSMFGLGGELAAAMMEHAFDELDAPVGRLHTGRVPFPFAPALDNEIAVSTAAIVTAAEQLVAGKATIPRHPMAEAAAARSQTPQPAAAPTKAVAAQAKAAAPVAAPVAGDGVAVIMPNMDLTIEKATVVNWIKKVGDRVDAGEPVVEVETDKAVVGIEAPAAGRLTRIVAAEGDVVKLGQTLGFIDPKAEG